MTGADAWTRLLELFDSDAREYERVRDKLVQFFAWKQCIDATDLADQVFDRVANKLAGGETIEADDPAHYVLGVARLVYLETVKREVRQRRALDRGKAAGEPDPDGTRETEVRLQALEQCMKGLPADQRDLVLRYHEGSGHSRIVRRREIAEELGVPMNALRIRLHRLRGQLEDCVRGKLPA